MTTNDQVDPEPNVAADQQPVIAMSQTATGPQIVSESQTTTSESSASAQDTSASLIQQAHGQSESVVTTLDIISGGVGDQPKLVDRTESVGPKASDSAPPERSDKDKTKEAEDNYMAANIAEDRPMQAAPIADSDVQQTQRQVLQPDEQTVIAAQRLVELNETFGTGDLSLSQAKTLVVSEAPVSIIAQPPIPQISLASMAQSEEPSAETDNQEAMPLPSEMMDEQLEQYLMQSRQKINKQSDQPVSPALVPSTSVIPTSQPGSFFQSGQYGEDLVEEVANDSAIDELPETARKYLNIPSVSETQPVDLNMQTVEKTLFVEDDFPLPDTSQLVEIDYDTIEVAKEVERQAKPRVRKGQVKGSRRVNLQEEAKEEVAKAQKKFAESVKLVQTAVLEAVNKLDRCYASDYINNKPIPLSYLADDEKENLMNMMADMSDKSQAWYNPALLTRMLQSPMGLTDTAGLAHVRALHNKLLKISQQQSDDTVNTLKGIFSVMPQNTFAELSQRRSYRFTYWEIYSMTDGQRQSIFEQLDATSYNDPTGQRDLVVKKLAHTYAIQELDRRDERAGKPRQYRSDIHFLNKYNSAFDRFNKIGSTLSSPSKRSDLTSIRHLQGIVLDWANVREAMRVDKDTLDRLLDYFYSHGCMPVFIYVPNSPAITTTREHYIVYPYSNVTDDLLSLAMSQHTGYPIMTNDRFNEFQSSIKYCQPHNKIVERVGTKCGKPNVTSQCVYKLMFPEPWTRLTLTTANPRPGPKSWISGKPYVVEKHTAKPVLNVDPLTKGDFELIMRHPRMLGKSTRLDLTLWAFRHSDERWYDYCVLTPSSIPAGGEGPFIRRIAVDNYFEKAGKLDLTDTINISKGNKQFDIDIKNAENLRYYTDQIVWRTERGLSVNTISFNSKAESVFSIAVVFTVKSMNAARKAYLRVNDKIMEVELTKATITQLMNAMIQNIQSGGIAEPTLYSRIPVPEDERLQLTGIPFNAIPGMPGAAPQPGEFWGQLSRNAETLLNAANAASATPQLFLSDADKMNKVAAYALLAIKNVEGQDNEQNYIFTGPVKRFEELPRIEAESIYPSILSPNDLRAALRVDKIADEITVNCTLGEIKMASSNFSQSLRANTAVITPLIMKVVRAMVAQMADMFLELIRDEKISRLPQFVKGIMISKDYVRDNVRFPIRFNYTFPYALVIGCMTGYREDYAMFMYIIPSPPIISAVVSAIAAKETYITNVYNDMETADAEAVAAEYFFQYVEMNPTEDIYDFFQPFYSVYTLLHPGLMAIGINDPMVITKAILTRLKEGTIEQIGKRIDAQHPPKDRVLTKWQLIKDEHSQLISRGGYGYKTAFKVTAQEMHEVLQRILEMQPSVDKRRVLTRAVYYIPGFVSNEMVVEHLALCFQLHLRGDDLIEFLYRTVKTMTPSRCRTRSPRFPDLGRQAITSEITNDTIAISTGQAVATIVVNERRLAVEVSALDNRTVINAVTGHKCIEIHVVGHGDDKTSYNAMTALAKATSSKDNRKIMIALADWNEAWDRLMIEVADILDEGNHSIMIFTSDKLGSKLKTAKKKANKMYVRPGVKIYVPGSILYSALSSHIVAIKDYSPSEVAGSFDHTERRAAEDIAQQTAAIEPIEEGKQDQNWPSTIYNYMEQTYTQVKNYVTQTASRLWERVKSFCYDRPQLVAGIAAAAVVVVASWPLIGWLVIWPYKMCCYLGRVKASGLAAYFGRTQTTLAARGAGTFATLAWLGGLVYFAWTKAGKQ